MIKDYLTALLKHSTSWFEEVINVHVRDQRERAPSVSAWLGFPSQILSRRIWGSTKKTSGSMILWVLGQEGQTLTAHTTWAASSLDIMHTIPSDIPTSRRKQRTNLQQNTNLHYYSTTCLSTCQPLCLSYVWFFLPDQLKRRLHRGSSLCTKILFSCTISISAVLYSRISLMIFDKPNFMVIMTWHSGLDWDVVITITYFAFAYMLNGVSVFTGYITIYV